MPERPRDDAINAGLRVDPANAYLYQQRADLYIELALADSFRKGKFEYAGTFTLVVAVTEYSIPLYERAKADLDDGARYFSSEEFNMPRSQCAIGPGSTR
jgi:hypothetical protein